MKRTIINGIPFKSKLLPGANPLEEKFINYIMLDGKKSTAREIFAQMLEEMKKLGAKDTHETFALAIENASPAMEVRRNASAARFIKYRLKFPRIANVFSRCAGSSTPRAVRRSSDSPKTRGGYFRNCEK